MKTALDYRDVGHDYALCCSDDKQISEERGVAGSIPNFYVCNHYFFADSTQLLITLICDLSCL